MSLQKLYIYTVVRLLLFLLPPLLAFGKGQTQPSVTSEPTKPIIVRLDPVLSAVGWISLFPNISGGGRSFTPV